MGAGVGAGAGVGVGVGAGGCDGGGFVGTTTDFILGFDDIDNPSVGRLEFDAELFDGDLIELVGERLGRKTPPDEGLDYYWDRHKEETEERKGKLAL